MAVTTNGTPTDSWQLASSGAGTLTIGSKYVDLETINHNSASTPPADTLEGFKVAQGEVQAIPMQTADHIWYRINRTNAAATDDGTPVSVMMKQAA